MIKHLYSFLCVNVLVDKMSNLASYINVIPGGVVDVLPKEMPAVWLATCWLCTDKPVGEFIVRVNLRTPSDKITPIKDLPVADPEQDQSQVRRHMVNLHIGKFTVGEEGLHFFEIEYKEQRKRSWKKAAQVPLLVQLQEVL